MLLHGKGFVCRIMDVGKIKNPEKLNSQDFVLSNGLILYQIDV